MLLKQLQYNKKIVGRSDQLSQKLKENEDKAKNYLAAVGSKAYNTCLIKNNLS